jgi:dolichyl-phosphate-mannose--protein O-mannosyl transferase
MKLFTTYMTIATIIFIACVQYHSIQIEYTTVTKKDYIKTVFFLFILSMFFPITIIYLFFTKGEEK